MKVLFGSFVAAAVLIPVASHAATAADDSARRFVAQVALPGESDEPSARFTYPLCVGTAGLPSEAGEVIVDRIAAVAASAGLSIARPGCAPNLMVVFVEDSRAAVRTLSQGRSGTLVGKSPTDIGYILAEEGRARAWTLVEARSRDGDRPRYSPTGATTLDTATSTRLSSPTRRDIVSSVVLIDREAVADRDLRQVADYAAVRGLTGARLGALTMPREPSILMLFTPQGDAQAPAALTAADRGFLRAFYTVRADLTAPMQRQRITYQMARARVGDTDGTPTR